MKTERLIENIIDQVKEAQIKLGYVREAVRLYYPLSSLNALLGTEFEEVEEMILSLRADPDFGSTGIGPLSFARHRDNIEISITVQGTEYVRRNVEDPPFLTDLIHLFQNNHHCSLEEIGGVFAKYDADYICEKMPDGREFDYVMHFSDPGIDPYFYCIKMEMGHVIYHRFAKQDYIMLLQ